MQKPTPKKLEWNYNHLLDQHKQIQLSINKGNWKGMSENLLERKSKAKAIRAYLDYCSEGNDCVLWRFCDVYDWYLKKCSR